MRLGTRVCSEWGWYSVKQVYRNLRKVESLFVDRDFEITCFRRVFHPDGADRPVYYIIGENEIGKSWLLYKFYMECVAQGWLTIMIDFSRAQGAITDYLSILREIQITLEQPFKRYQERTAKALQIQIPVIQTGAGDAGRAVDIDQGAEIKGVEFSGQFAARDIINFYVQLGNQNVLRQIDGIRQLTEAFLEDLKEYVGKRWIIFLFDEIGSDAKGTVFLDSQTRRWLIEDFIIPLCDDLPTARFVITQRDELERNLQTMLSDLVIRHTLTEFKGDENSIFEIYRTYLTKDGIDPTLVNDALLNIMHSWVQGRPAKMSTAAQAMKGLIKELK